MVGTYCQLHRKSRPLYCFRNHSGLRLISSIPTASSYSPPSQTQTGRTNLALLLSDKALLANLSQDQTAFTFIPTTTATRTAPISRTVTYLSSIQDDFSIKRLSSVLILLSVSVSPSLCTILSVKLIQMSILWSYPLVCLYVFRLCALSSLSFIYYYFVSTILCVLACFYNSLSVPCHVHLIMIIIVSNFIHVLTYRLFSVSIIYPVCLNFILPFYFKFTYKFCAGRI